MFLFVLTILTACNFKFFSKQLLSEFLLSSVRVLIRWMSKTYFGLSKTFSLLSGNFKTTNFLSAVPRIILSGPCLWLPFPWRTSWLHGKIVYYLYSVCCWDFTLREKAYRCGRSRLIEAVSLMLAPRLWTFKLLAVVIVRALTRGKVKLILTLRLASFSESVLVSTPPGTHDQILVVRMSL
jgi:hypothetical protein